MSNRTMWLLAWLLWFGVGLNYLGVFYTVVLSSVLDVTLTFFQLYKKKVLDGEMNPLVRWLIGLRGGPRPRNYLLAFCFLLPLYVWFLPLLSGDGLWLFAGVLLAVNAYHIGNIDLAIRKKRMRVLYGVE